MKKIYFIILMFFCFLGLMVKKVEALPVENYWAETNGLIEPIFLSGLAKWWSVGGELIRVADGLILIMTVR